jgi:hypothetical protein
MRHDRSCAQKLGRQWIGIDITYLAINLIKRRLKDAFGDGVQFEEKGQPTDFASAKRLAELINFSFNSGRCRWCKRGLVMLVRGAEQIVVWMV